MLWRASVHTSTTALISYQWVIVSKNPAFPNASAQSYRSLLKCMKR
jgi:hypothetical protein